MDTPFLLLPLDGRFSHWKDLRILDSIGRPDTRTLRLVISRSSHGARQVGELSENRRSRCGAGRSRGEHSPAPEAPGQGAREGGWRRLP